MSAIVWGSFTCLDVAASAQRILKSFSQGRGAAVRRELSSGTSTSGTVDLSGTFRDFVAICRSDSFEVGRFLIE